MDKILPIFYLTAKFFSIDNFTKITRGESFEISQNISARLCITTN